MKKLVLTALLLIAALPSMAQTGVFKLSLWDQVALATPPNTQDIRGIDFGIGSKTATVTGVQLDLLFAQTECEQRGASMAWIVNLAGDVYGAQMGLLAKADNAIGAQLGLVNLSAHASTGAQVGFFNQAEYMNGVQFGLVNYARTIDGLQVGILNIAENGYFPAMVLVNGRF